MDDDELLALPDIPLLFGRYLVLRGFITEADLTEALDFQNDIRGTLACAALEAETISLREYIHCREYQRSHAVIFEQAATTLGYLDEDRLIALLHESDLTAP